MDAYIHRNAQLLETLHSVPMRGPLTIHITRLNSQYLMTDGKAKDSFKEESFFMKINPQ